MFMRGFMEKMDLFAITPAPLAIQQMQAEPETRGGRKRTVKLLGLSPSRLSAIHGQDSPAGLEFFEK